MTNPMTEQLEKKQDYHDISISLGVRVIGICEKCMIHWQENRANWIMKKCEIGNQ